MNTRYYLKNGTISVEPINEDNADFFIVNYEINGERKFFYKNDEILLNIDCELVSLYDKLYDMFSIIAICTSDIYPLI